jgi:hypothetical protein
MREKPIHCSPCSDAKEITKMYKPRTCLWIVLTLSVLFAGATGVWAVEDDKPAGTVSIQSTSIAAGVGVNWGDGTLTLNDGRRFPFSLQGLQIGSVGYSQVNAQGKVYHLTKVDDFEGTYAAVEASIAAGSGPGVLAMRNQHGVVIELESTQQGVKLTIGPQGVQTQLKQ